MSAKNKFNVSQNEIDGINILSLSGFLDAHTAPILEDKISNIIKNGNNKILINFSDLDYISSAGLGVFMAFIEELRQSGGDIKMAAMKPKVFTIFDLLGFPLLFDIEKTEQEALLKFKSSK
ncbi:MAG: STAS domain-containing protein [Candidatus Kapabacteria bacterium]|nr:STAS domain-containing protein [Candidatus Kapabacteria bacterium]